MPFPHSAKSTLSTFFADAESADVSAFNAEDFADITGGIDFADVTLVCEDGQQVWGSQGYPGCQKSRICWPF